MEVKVFVIKCGMQKCALQTSIRVLQAINSLFCLGYVNTYGFLYNDIQSSFGLLSVDAQLLNSVDVNFCK